MSKSISVALCMAIAFTLTVWLTTSPAWVALIISLIAGMWCDLRNGR